MADLKELPAASQVYSALRAGIDPIVRPLGYSREKSGPPTWAQAESSGPKTAFWAQVNAKAVDSYSGGELLFEFERLTGRRTAAKLPGRARLDQLLVPSEMELMLEHQNALIASLPRPPVEQVEAYPESLREMYLQEFEPQRTFRPGNFWLRYLTIEHVQEWLPLVAELLPRVLDRAARLEPSVGYMGRSVDLDATPLSP